MLQTVELLVYPGDRDTGTYHWQTKKKIDDNTGLLHHIEILLRFFLLTGKYMVNKSSLMLSLLTTSSLLCICKTTNIPQDKIIGEPTYKIIRELQDTWREMQHPLIVHSDVAMTASSEHCSQWWPNTDNNPLDSLLFNFHHHGLRAIDPAAPAAQSKSPDTRIVDCHTDGIWIGISSGCVDARHD